MARLAERLPQNVPGEFFVDSTCIDCGICRWVAPASFGRSDSALSFVRRQPSSDAERERAFMALVACPTASIGTVSRLDAGTPHPGVRALPDPVAEDVYFCGYASRASYGACSWLIRRPQGNVLVDSPRAAAPLLSRLEELGGVRWMFLTHRDDVADHAKFRERFGCERVLHRDDVTRATSDIERKIEGSDPFPLSGDLTAVPVPGHTRGSLALLYRDEFLFTGDHLWWSSEDRALDASRGVCWYSWPAQIRSMEKLLAL